MSLVNINSGPIGVFDSGFGGLTVLKKIVKQLPDYNYLYLGDNARAPYGTRSFDTVYNYTLQCVNWFFNQGCSLVILACNTASAKALRTIQQQDLPNIDSTKRVLGVIRPTTEIIGNYTTTNCVGILGTLGTVQSLSYPIEITKFYPQIKVFQEACPMWVSLVENNEHNKPGADYFIQKHLQNLLIQNANIDTILLACTHFPLLIDKIKSYLPDTITVVSQGDIVATSLSNYLNKHTSLASKCEKGGKIAFYTTDAIDDFNNKASIFYGSNVKAMHTNIG